MIIILEFIGGLLLFAFGSAAFWYAGQERAFTPKQRGSAVTANLMVFVVLGGWAGGAGFVAHAIMRMLGLS